MDTGQRGHVIEIKGGQGIAGRLNALDIRPGRELIKVSSMLMHGPVTVQVGSAQVAIGFGMASKIMVAID